MWIPRGTTTGRFNPVPIGMLRIRQTKSKLRQGLGQVEVTGVLLEENFCNIVLSERFVYVRDASLVLFTYDPQLFFSVIVFSLHILILNDILCLMSKSIKLRFIFVCGLC